VKADFPARQARAGIDFAAMTSNRPTRYRIAIHRAKGCYFARVIELPGCTSRGATEVEAVENARNAIRAFLWIAQVLSADQATVELEISA
jgi:predicted RNase H-like HicB family nuclease